MRSQQDPSRHSTLCLVPHLGLARHIASFRACSAKLLLSDSWARNPLARGGGSDVCKTQKARTEVWRRLAYVCQRGNLGQEAALQRLCLRPRSTWRCKIQPHEIETRVAKAAQAGRSPEGLLPFTFYLHSGCRKQRTHEPERGHTASETAAVSKGRHPICPEHEEDMQNATCACGRKRPARRANANWRIVSPPSRPNFTVRPPI